MEDTTTVSELSFISILAKTSLPKINVIIQLQLIYFDPGMLTESAIFCKTRSYIMAVVLYYFNDWS